MIHIYSAELQPATDFVDRSFDPEMRFHFAPRKRVWAECCRRHRIAANCEVQVYYDGVRVFCAPGRGCKVGKVGGR